MCGLLAEILVSVAASSMLRWISSVPPAIGMVGLSTNRAKYCGLGWNAGPAGCPDRACRAKATPHERPLTGARS
jgi:hypothetical protein